MLSKDDLIVTKTQYEAKQQNAAATVRAFPLFKKKSFLRHPVFNTCRFHKM
jgi:hypothetical protein